MIFPWKWAQPFGFAENHQKNRFRGTKTTFGIFGVQEIFAAWAKHGEPMVGFGFAHTIELENSTV